MLFPGKNYIQQIKLVVEKLGKPNEAEMETIQNPNALKFINGLPGSKRHHAKDYIKYENPELIDLLEKMLQYDPEKRITAEDSVKHP